MDTEEQQVEALKKWWKENGSSIVTGVVLGLAVLFGAKAYFSWQERTAQQASVLYAVMMRDADAGKIEVASENAENLIAEYGGTPYASLAALLLAKFRIEADDPAAARSQLQWVVDNAPSDELRTVARLRLARVLVDLNELDTALDVLDNGLLGDADQAIAGEIRGDIYSLRGDAEQAADAYQQALAFMTPDYPAYRIVQLKYDNAVASAPPAADGTQ